eukprot:TRINITY_DN12625_c0_g1_i1.p1 TRINITY_DN12625_c0_g1~~TRINITY_DN12625_c0_g1_i1.p1  ORF type:complete len:215 (-),score=39.08 TRINITY_DN12625_c0_g1_i1:24-668(-)
MFDDEVFIGGENSFNLFTVRKNTNAVSEEERSRLNVIGQYHLGEYVNVFKHGSLVMYMPDPDVNMIEQLPPLEPRDLPNLERNPSRDSLQMDKKEEAKEEDFHSSSALKRKLIYGTVNGSVGVIASLTKSQFDFLYKIQKALAKNVKFIGGFSHAKYRMFSSDSSKKDAHNFVDGDLIEFFLTLSPDKMTQIANECSVSVDYLVKQIDDLARIK